MNRITKVFSTLYDHKKKSIFGAACLSYLFYYLDKRFKENDIFRDYCEKAKVFGDNILTSFTPKPRRVTVLLNEFAKNGKCRYDFEKFALPLLHLAGLEVTVIKPQDAEQLRNVASVLDRQEADVVYVVGGDGTVSQVVNGMMQMIKSPTSSTTPTLKSFPPPIGIFPGGCENVSLKQLLPQVNPNVKWYCENAMALIRGALSMHGVFEVQLDDKEPFYGFQYFHQGPFQNVEKIKWKYWYWGSLKHSFAYFWTALKEKPISVESVVQYVEPCSGCSKCYAPSKDSTGTGRGFLRGLFGLSQPQKPKGTDYSKVINPNCGNIVENDVKTVEILINNDKNQRFKNFHVAVGPAVLGRRGFFREGKKREATQPSGLDPSESFVEKTFNAREVTISPDTKTASNSEESHFRISIDGDVHEFANKIKLKMIPDVIQCIVPQQ